MIAKIILLLAMVAVRDIYADANLPCDCGSFNIPVPSGPVPSEPMLLNPLDSFAIGSPNCNEAFAPKSYPSNCYWSQTVTSRPGSLIGVRIPLLKGLDLNYNESQGCLDYIRFSNIVNGVKVVFGPQRICRQSDLDSVSWPLYSATSSIVLESFSGGTNYNLGNMTRYFEVAFFSVNNCGGSIRVRPKGIATFLSPNYPFEYPINLDCVYNIVSDPGTIIKFTSKFFAQSGFGCRDDGMTGITFSEVKNGVNATFVDSPLCGYNSSETVLSTTNSVMVLLRTVSSTTTSTNPDENRFQISAQAQAQVQLETTTTKAKTEEKPKDNTGVMLRAGAMVMTIVAFAIFTGI